MKEKGGPFSVSRLADVSTTLYSSICSIVRVTQDLEKMQWSQSLTSNLDFKLVHERKRKLLQEDRKEYLVDKVVRRRLSEGTKFGFDNSELIRLNITQASHLQPNVGHFLKQTLAASLHPSRARASYEEWKQRKDAEKRMKSQLLRELEEEEKREREGQVREEMREKEEKKARVAKWRAEKEREARAKYHATRKSARQTRLQASSRRHQSQTAYREWLQADALRLKSKGLREDSLKEQAEIREMGGRQRARRQDKAGGGRARSQMQGRNREAEWEPDRRVVVTSSMLKSTPSSSYSSSYEDTNPSQSSSDLPGEPRYAVADWTEDWQAGH